MPDKIKVDERGFVRHNSAKLCRVTSEGVQFEARGRHGEKQIVTVPREKMAEIMSTPLTTAPKVNKVEGERSGDG